MSESQPRVFLGLCEIAGYYSGLKRGLKELGIAATLCPLDEHPFKYGESEALPNLASLIRSARAARQQSGPLRPLRKLVRRMYEKILLLRLLRWALPRHDVFVFGFKSTFLKSYTDLSWLRRSGKQVLCVFHGSDSRPPYLDGAWLRADNNLSVDRCIRLNRRQQRDVRAIERFAHRIIANPYSAHFHQREFLSFFALGIPCVLEPEMETPTVRKPDGLVRILHCPSHPESKGTATIREIIADFKTRRLPVEYAEIIGQPNTAVQAALRRCDFVVDQLYSDTPMAGFAAEAAAWSRPALVGSYAARDFKEGIPGEFLPPTQTCYPEEAAAGMEMLVKNQQYRVDLGRRAHEFVRKQWNHKVVAGRLLKVIQGDVPDAWNCNPKALRYLHGYGLSEARVQAQVRALVERGGPDSLCLANNPQLQSLMLQFASQS